MLQPDYSLEVVRDSAVLSIAAHEQGELPRSPVRFRNGNEVAEGDQLRRRLRWRRTAAMMMTPLAM